MAAQELNRVDILRKVDEKRLSQKEAAKLLGCTTRNIRYLQARYHPEGVALFQNNVASPAIEHSQLHSRQMRKSAQLLQAKRNNALRAVKKTSLDSAQAQC